MSLLCHTLNAGLVVDETLQHHHEAPRPLAERAVGVLLQEGKQLGPDLGQHSGHVVSCQRVAVVQIHHCILQVAGQGHRGTQRDTEVRGQKPETSSQAHIIYCRNEQERNCCMWKKTSKFHIYNLKFDLFSYKSCTRITCTDLQLLQGSNHGDKGLLHQWLNYFGSLNVKRRPWLLLWLPAHCVNVTAKIELCHRHLCPVLVLRLHYI